MGLFSAIGGLFGGNKAAKRLNKDLRKIADEIEFNPYNVSGPLGFGRFDGTTASASLSPDLAQSFESFGKLLAPMYSDAQEFNPGRFSSNYFRAIDQLESQREQEGFASLESRLFNQSGVHTGTQQQVRDYRTAVEQARRDRATKALFDTQSFYSNMLNQILGLEQGRSALGASAIDPLRLGASFGQIETDVDVSRGELLKEGAGVRAGATANTWKSVGGILDAGASIFGRKFF